ncbi:MULTISPECIES: class I adenylate-forming enzyme family protein [unclassified Archaeoglobus]|jgi:fatty-acyl-CoA synthase|uniref:class I adenylate-forming enzyme family protein n=1 Tax=unclassified Archaeoglobus TaxID=2643606 RepID=UPI0025BFD8B2|nr:MULTISPECIES: AMP-binding protein [unclassified Archaeoglobus]
MKTIPQLLNELADIERPSIFYNDEGFSYKDFVKKVDEVAYGLKKLGLGKGDRVAIIALNQPEWLYTFFGSTKIGIEVVALNVRYREAELNYMLTNSRAKAVVCLPEFAGFDYQSFFAKADFPNLEYEIYIGDSERGIPFSELEGETSDGIEKMSQEVTENDTAVIIYTSGTTGRPKGAKLTHKSLLSSAVAERDHINATESDVGSIHLPLNHVGGVTCTLLTVLTAKGSVVLVPYFDPNKVLSIIENHKVTIFGGVPTMYHMLFNTNFDEYDVSSVRVAIIGGSAPLKDLVVRIREKFKNAKIMHLYGLTESSGACLLSPLVGDVESLFDPRGMPVLGLPIDGYQVKIVDDRGNELPEGEVGEIAVKGDCVCDGYVGLEKETSEAFRDGWLFTGDLGYKKGNLVYFMGRKKEMFVQAGYNVYPAEVETILISHPKVAMVAVIGVKDEFYGEKGVAYVIPEGDVTEEELRDYCSKYIADYKIPKEFIFTNTLPLTPIGKIQKSELIKMYEKR